jgi:D-cysteine desulfhydrase
MTELSDLARVPLVLEPTPLTRAERLSEAVGVELWLKRDDLTGIGLGGNKLRGLEFLLGDALAKASDCVVTGGGPQSNWAMLAALTARLAGLEPFVVHYGTPPTEVSGNQLLCGLLGVDRRFTGEADRASVDHGIDRLTKALARQGRRPYPIVRGGADPLGVTGYVRGGLELDDQVRVSRLTPSHVWLASGSCGTQAGLVAAAHLLGWTSEVVGVTVSRPRDDAERRVGELARATCELLAIGPVASTRWRVVGGYAGPAHGRPSPAGQAAAQLVLRTEGVLLDPVFAAKAFAALMDAARAEELNGPVVFLVSGGAPTVFAM